MATRPEARPAPVVIQGLSKSFLRAGGESVTAVRDVNLTVDESEIVVLLGPSGCGKTTLLRCIAGLEQPSAGSIRIAGDDVFDAGSDVFVAPNHRDVNMMFQSYALWPHMTLEDNVGYPLRISGTKRKVARTRANEYLELVGLAGLGKQYGGNVSGGQQQRAALARTLISQPAVVLFDEPLSNVDAKVRAQLRTELLRLHAELDFAAVYVTHDQGEAMALGTKLAVMRDGAIDQFATPVETYEAPTTAYVAQFVGVANILDAQIKEVSTERDELLVESTIGTIVATCPNQGFDDLEPDSQVRVMIRPEYCTVSEQGDATHDEFNGWAGTIESAVYAGTHTEYTCRLNGQPIIAWRNDKHPLPVGSDVIVTFPKDSVRLVMR